MPAARRPLLGVDPQRVLEGRGWIILLVLADLVALTAGVVAARIGARAAGVEVTGEALLWVSIPLSVMLLTAFGGYRPKLDTRILGHVGVAIAATTGTAMTLITVGTLVQSRATPAFVLTREWLFSTLYLAAMRVALHLVQRHARRDGRLGQLTLIMGAGQVGTALEERIRLHPELGLRVIGYADTDPPPASEVPKRRAPVLGPLSALPAIVKATGTKKVILAFLYGPGSDRLAAPIIRECEAMGVDVWLVPRLYEQTSLQLKVDQLGPMTLLRLRSVDPKGWQFIVKYATDRVVAALLIILSAPVILACALAVKLSSPGPVLFRQARVGLDDREFEMLKFRTMSGSPEQSGQANAAWAEAVGREHSGGKETDEPAVPERRTRVGGFLRRYSLDELPQFFNVLKGDMALVGPRPEQTIYVRAFEREISGYGDRHRVKSGLTGLAQVQGLRGNTSLEERVAWDNYYIENWSLSLDLGVMLATVAAVLKGAE